jgi:hypothetical protein
VERVVFSLLRQMLAQHGCVEGDVIRCAASKGPQVHLLLQGGKEVWLPRELAWFVEVSSGE